ncbi:MAG: TIGR00725 family protein [Nanoarchaeota archaeon]|nr:TIGR00725 family protein [Nanoarchaeota archaeon]
MKLHEIVRAAPKIGVFGSDGEHCTERAKELAYETGQLLAEKGAILFTGGSGGVMRYASKGAIEKEGLVIGICPGEKRGGSDDYSSITIPTGLGFVARGQVLTNSVDGAIIIEGGLGTYQEVLSMYYLQRPCVAIKTSGGVAEEVAGRSLDRRGLNPILEADSPEQVVEVLFDKLKKLIS